MRKLENFIRFHGLVLRVIRELAPGGMGDILLCEEVSSKGKFVLKSKRSSNSRDASPTIVRSYTDFINDPNFKRFKDEVVAYVQLIHTNIVDFYGFEVVNGIPRILLSFVEGGTIADWISNGKALHLKTAMQILIQVATGLQFAHEHDLIHRDLKPSNILMKEKSDNSFITKISDFGIVKISADITSSGVTDLQDGSGINTDAIGTPGYGSPEQFHLVSGKVDKNTDLFSFGIIATEMLSRGNIPKLYSWFQSDSVIKLDQDSLVSNVDKFIKDYFSRYNSNCPQELVQLIIKCLEIDPAARWLAEKEAGIFNYFETILRELKIIYRTLFGEDYEFFEPDMDLNEDLRYIYRAKTLEGLGYSEDQTRGLFDKALNVEPVGFVGWSNRSKYLLDTKKPKEALEAAIKSISLNEKHVLAWYNKGNALDELGKSEEAIEAFDHAIKVDPTYSLSYYYKAKALTRLRIYDEALNSYCKALEIDRYDISSWYDKEKLLYDLQLYENALESLEKIIEIDPNHVNAWFRKGEVQIALDNLPDAVTCFDKVIELDENSYDAWANRGILFRKKVREILKARNGHLTLAEVNEIFELFDQAKKSYDKAIQIKPTDGLLFFGRAALYIERTLVDQSNKELVEKGLEDLKKAIQLDSNLRNNAKTESIFRLISEDQRFKDLVES